MKKIAAFVNLNSGSVPSDAEVSLARVLSDFGYDADIMAFQEGDVKDALQRVIDLSTDYMIAWGGDGSINCALSISGLNGPPVLALPGGTMNLLHQRLHNGRTQWEDILNSALTEPEAAPWAAGEVNGQRFYVAVMVGRLTTLSESRELFRSGAILEAISAAAKNQAFDMETRLQLRSHIGSRIVSTSATAGAIVMAGEKRPRFDVAAIDPSTQLDLITVGIQSLLSGWRDAEDVSVETAGTVTVEDVNGDTIPATIDGEPIELPPVSEFHLVPFAAKVLRAKPPA